MVVSYLQDLFSMGSFKRKTISPALENLDIVLRDNPDDPEAHIFKVWIQMVSTDDDNLKKAQELKPEWSLPYFLLGLFHKNRGGMEEAEKWLRQALEKKAELLTKRKKELEAKIDYCQKLLTSK
jgi:tetratricopeptide (TPR) repeat protein